MTATTFGARRRPLTRLVQSERVGTALVVIALIGGVQWMSVAEVGGSSTIPRPRDIASSIVDELTSSTFWTAVRVTMEAWGVGLALAVVVGVTIGGLIGASDLLFRSTRGTLDALRAVPPVALVPLAVLTLGVGQKLLIVLIAVVCVWPILLQATAGVHSVDPGARITARSLRMSRLQLVRWVVIPSALPFIGTGLRLAAVMALLVAVAAQLLAGASGLGLQIYLSQTSGDNPGMWAVVVLTGLLGLGIARLFSLVERRLTMWLPENRQG